jgi:hypothetical protein
MKLPDKNNATRKLAGNSGFVIFLMIQLNNLSYSQTQIKYDLKDHEKSFSEELYIRTDRDLYASGEKVWFKIYKLNGLTHSEVNISKVVYADILDLENNPVIQLKIAVNGNSGSGNFTLPDTLRSGNYILRAYTNWMQNFSKDLFACKSISVINPFDKISNLKIPLSASNPDSVIFYPEGGHLLSDVESQLGFRTLNRKGSPVIADGFVITDKNDTICSLKSGNNGYGLVRLTPKCQTQLFMVYSDNGQVRRFPLPEVQKEGILLSAPGKNEKSGAIVTLKFSSGYMQGDKHLYLLINSSGLAGVRREIRAGSESGISISASELPIGISYFSVVDEREKVLTDRWIFKEYKNPIAYKINLPDNGYHPRQKIRIDITATDNRGNPVESDFSVSVAKDVSINRKGLNNTYWQMPGVSLQMIVI